MNISRRPVSAGFTLVEILVALLVLAIALTATVRGLGAAVDTTAALRERTLARWVAEDNLSGIELRQEWPALDVKEGDSEMGGRAFHWRQETSPTPVARMRRIEISVLLPGSDVPLMHLTGFVEQTGPQAALQAPPAGSPAGLQPGSPAGPQPGLPTGPGR